MDSEIIFRNEATSGNSMSENNKKLDCYIVTFKNINLQKNII